jgi:hypothetical protein
LLALLVTEPLSLELTQKFLIVIRRKWLGLLLALKKRWTPDSHPTLRSTYHQVDKGREQSHKHEKFQHTSFIGSCGPRIKLALKEGRLQ